jgi:threonine dehydrogenase-like Zn-dependent dehydrogenase
LCIFPDLGFTVTHPSDLKELMPKDRFEAEDDGVDIIIDCTGVPAALEQAIFWTKMG